MLKAVGLGIINNMVHMSIPTFRMFLRFNCKYHVVNIIVFASHLLDFGWCKLQLGWIVDCIPDSIYLNLVQFSLKVMFEHCYQYPSFLSILPGLISAGSSISGWLVVITNILQARSKVQKGSAPLVLLSRQIIKNPYHHPFPFHQHPP